jgi:hypothetical protein
VQVDPVKLISKAPKPKRLKPKYDEMLSIVAFNSSSRHYNTVIKMVLATDMVEHFNSVGQFKTKLASKVGATLVHFSTQLEPCLTHTKT